MAGSSQVGERSSFVVPGSTSDFAGPADNLPRAPRWRRLLTAILDGHFFAAQPERLIRVARLASSIFALLAIYLDPTQPTQNVSAVYVILITYLVYSASLATITSKRSLEHRSHYITHAIDILVLGILAFLSGEMISPFFAFFTFTLLIGSIRWGIAGAVVTVLILVCLLVAVGWPINDPDHFYVNVLIMRTGYALVAAALLGYFVSSREHSRKRLEQLAAWPPNIPENEDKWLESALSHASAVLGNVRFLVIWNETDEPTGRLVYWLGTSGEFHEAPADSCRQLVEAEEQTPSFAYGPLKKLLALPPELETLVGDRLFAHRASDRNRPALCSAHFVSPRYRGRLLVLDPGLPGDDMLALTQIVASRIAAELEQLSMMRELAAAAGWRERRRLARDLHDSVLQNLAAASLQLKAAAGGQPDSLISKINEVNSLLTEQQSRIRSFVESARPSPPAPEIAMREQLLMFAQVLSGQWQCDVSVDIVPGDMAAPSRIVTEICQVAAEATANAVRHGEAKHVSIAIRQDQDAIVLIVNDDGKGAPELTSPDAIQPASIRERIRDLGGEVKILPSGIGLHLAIRLPV